LRRGDRRLPMLVATVPAVLALCGTLSLAAVQVLTQPPDRPAQTCRALVEHVADLAEKHPTVADIYAADKGPRLPRLADAEEIRRCGDPAILLRELGRSKAPTTPP